MLAKSEEERFGITARKPGPGQHTLEIERGIMPCIEDLYLSNSTRNPTNHCFAVKWKRTISRLCNTVAQIFVANNSSRSVEHVPENSRRQTFIHPKKAVVARDLESHSARRGRADRRR
ncbi:magnesium transporter CorA-like family protein [Striga asiatica]|uniref:Magnesium transporter CorA-like family protein n=1 Tax=Striga asiatica TaxID=4170 RepID=A0A5A7QS42_STRAF|nr:magnesium transporter CorA-like family protein [Striga asiatica]